MQAVVSVPAQGAAPEFAEVVLVGLGLPGVHLAVGRERELDSARVLDPPGQAEVVAGVVLAEERRELRTLLGTHVAVDRRLQHSHWAPLGDVQGGCGREAAGRLVELDVGAGEVAAEPKGHRRHVAQHGRREEAEDQRQVEGQLLPEVEDRGVQPRGRHPRLNAESDGGGEAAHGVPHDPHPLVRHPPAQDALWVIDSVVPSSEEVQMVGISPDDLVGSAVPGRAVVPQVGQQHGEAQLPKHVRRQLHRVVVEVHVVPVRHDDAGRLLAILPGRGQPPGGDVDGRLALLALPRRETDKLERILAAQLPLVVEQVLPCAFGCPEASGHRAIAHIHGREGLAHPELAVEDTG
mmetsp:Transcript_78913/g.142337  ORF Transcript_78913/g.142337 Transcript_78913/m.142337 type:complete len:350 (-) Transcript_78913:380-1429(-)